MKLNYRDVFFYDIVNSILDYKPSIEIKPAHLANGFFRAICGGYVNNNEQHKSIYPKSFPSLVPNKDSSDNHSKHINLKYYCPRNTRKATKEEFFCGVIFSCLSCIS